MQLLRVKAAERIPVITTENSPRILVRSAVDVLRLVQ
jgi:hypothetical protein